MRYRRRKYDPRLLLLWHIISLCFFLAPKSQSQSFAKINIEIEQDSIDELEQHPFTNEDVHGNFIAGSQRIENVEIHYRGAYYLYSLMQSGDRRNWKIKTSKINRYLNRREWNFNYELQLRQRLAYLLMDIAGVPCVSAQHVELSVNGKRQGLYLQYEDPDNKRWLKETFGDNDGDLYKAAYDMPNQTKYFADLTYLGDEDADYFLHYRKQTNNNSKDEFNYESIREFTALINTTTDTDFDAVIRQNFNVSDFLKYLVVANFIAHWDGYPFRPKNYFLYQNPVDAKWNFIPWDMDATFQKDGHFNSIRTAGSVFHYFDGYEPYNKVEGEPIARPLVWNLMKNQATRDEYVAEYKSALKSYLSKDFLYQTLDSLWLGIRDKGNSYEKGKFHSDIADMKEFITVRFQNVVEELDSYELETGIQSSGRDYPIQGFAVFPNPTTGPVTVAFNTEKANSRISLYSLTGQPLFHTETKERNVFRNLDLSRFSNGVYLMVIESGSEKRMKRIIIRKE